MSLNIGTTLGAFEIVGLLGKGGMGEVYRAKDSKLGREVAIKVLPDVFAIDAERMARFEREARVLATLDHPNIGALYEFQEADGHHFLVMQLIEGETLADRIAKGAIPLDEALSIFAQIAEGLEAAHASGIVHRDLKPANIKIDESGRVKVLDFGLAMNPDGEVITIASPTDVTKPGDTPPSKVTTDGAIIGTPAYMAPEQARGKNVDKRADIWAFGCCLYEALTGKMPFDEDTISDTLAAVLKQEVDLELLPNDTPWNIRKLIERCVEKDVQYRLRDIGDAWSDLKKLTTESGRLTSAAHLTTAPHQARRGRTLLFSVVGAVVVAIVTGLAVRYWMESESSESAESAYPRLVHRFTIDPPDDWVREQPGYPTISPDGKYVAYTENIPNGTKGLMLRSFDGFDEESRKLFDDDIIFNPFFSPDGDWIAYMDGNSVQISKMRITGGAPVKISSRPINCIAVWGDDDMIYLSSPTTGVQRVSASGGDVEPLTILDEEAGEIGHLVSQILPGSKVLFYTIVRANTDRSVYVLSLDTMQSKMIIPSGAMAKFTPTGHLIYVHDNQLWAVGFDISDLETFGAPVPVLGGIAESTVDSNFDFSGSGTIVYMEGDDQEIDGATNSMVWVDREGKTEPLPIEPGPYLFPKISPDGRRIAVSQGMLTASNVWVHDLSGRSPFPVTFGNGNHATPIWTPDGRRVVFTDFQSIRWSAAAPGAIEPQDLFPMTGISVVMPTSWTPDGNGLIFQGINADGNTDIMAVSPETGDWNPVVSTPFDESAGVVSPDGEWIAYATTLTGDSEVWMQRFPDPEVGSVTPVSAEGGQLPVWSRDGSELFFLTNDSKTMMVVPRPKELDDAWEIPEPLFELPFHPEGFSAATLYDVAPDGRFLMVKAATDESGEEVSSVRMRVIVNWFEELKRLKPLKDEK